MIPINNSDTAWLIVSDYNQENDLPYEDLREDILTSDGNQWHYEYLAIITDIVKVWGQVGSIFAISVGDDQQKVGVQGLAIGGDRFILAIDSRWVGGHDPNQ